MHSSPIKKPTAIKHHYSYVTVNMPAPGGGTAPAHYKVGRKMEADLNPHDVVTGSATGPNWTWMQALRQAYPKANVVRGHLLNHDLGGRSVEENLYPISTSANGDHSRNVEVHVKERLYDTAKQGWDEPVHYEVLVSETNANNPEKAAFNCQWTWGPASHRQSLVHRVDSDLAAKSAYSGRATGPKLAAWDHVAGQSLVNERTQFAALGGGFTSRIRAGSAHLVNPFTGASLASGNLPALSNSVEASYAGSRKPEWWKLGHETIEAAVKQWLLEILTQLSANATSGDDTPLASKTIKPHDAADVLKEVQTSAGSKLLSQSVVDKYMAMLVDHAPVRDLLYGLLVSPLAPLTKETVQENFIDWVMDELL
ncbi:hypothetical protein LQR31_08735 [Chromobacterium vaccinii]|uniref:hypothetical protein n=1 Tax=Chromobacterium vaccinii TaxID=1108595 RepID=UPI001E4D8FE7|nr:hypothetical protein [Chromobacterium vaccinii]MCD4484553.1 hypothetical protein [Chromobacterium vaccinii]